MLVFLKIVFNTLAFVLDKITFFFLFTDFFLFKSKFVLSMVSVQKNKRYTAKALLENECDVNVQTRDGTTALSKNYLKFSILFFFLFFLIVIHSLVRNFFLYISTKLPNSFFFSAMSKRSWHTKFTPFSVLPVKVLFFVFLDFQVFLSHS
jgi:hypothetical protein